MNDITFSIIVPCFNVQDYLEACIDSLLSQTYERFEVLLIDDGSTDSSPSICDRYGKQDERIKVFHKKNGGLSDARNFGLERAHGDYIIFVDSDDFIERDALETFELVLRKTYPEVLLTRLTDYYGSDESNVQDEEMGDFFKDGALADRALLWEMTKSKSSWPVPKKILAKSFIDQHGLRFLKGYLHEDVDWSSRVMLSAEKFDISTAPWYYHRLKREGSIMNTMSSKRLTDVIKMASNLIDGSEMSEVSERKKELISNRIMRSLYPILTFYKCLSKDGKKEVIDCCNQNRHIFRLAPVPRYKLFVICTRIFGMRFALELLAKVS